MCKDVLENRVKEGNLKSYIENNFDIYLVGNKDEGLVTGYYHIALQGSKIKTEKFKYPLYGVPEDLIELNLKDFELKGTTSSGSSVTKLFGRVENKKIIPYYTSKEINKGAIENKASIIAYTDNEIERYLLHVQGSGTLNLEDGEKLKLGFAAKNGRVFRGIGSQLIAKKYVSGALNLENMLKAYDKYKEEISNIILNNDSYVFFKESNNAGVIGGMGVPVTAKRTLAVDLNYISYGVPMWLDMAEGNSRVSKLMVAQDTGGAIIGPNRLDFYWGEGVEAGLLAGNTKNKASVYILIPKV